ncbi:hypothetical protein ACEPAH_4359 [Sanghuangporus vaninii]
MPRLATTQHGSSLNLPLSPKSLSLSFSLFLVFHSPPSSPTYSIAHPSQPPQVPALYLYPLNDSFIPKQISLVGGQRVKIGRQTNAKTVPGERNGYFDSKVLSRQHAEVWEENSKIFIKDVKSSNGTFINGDRLSAEGVESDPYELKTDDIVEFGIDIVGEDNRTIIHHKVAARVTCIFNNEDALVAQREASNFTQQQMQQGAGPAGTLGVAAHKRPMLQPQSSGVGIMGGMGGGARQPGRNGLTFDHILQRLSGELQKSRETGAELGAVAGAMGEIENVMGGGQPPNLPPYPHVLPPVRPPSQQHPQQQGDAAPSSAALQALQSQLAETQASLSSHVDKVRTLESLLSDHENIKRDVLQLREMIEEQRQHERLVAQRVHEMHEEDEDEDDGRSVHTIVPHELESVPEEDETELEESEEERSARREELGRPRTPEPSSLGMHDDDYQHRRSAPAQPPGIPDEISRRLSFLSDQLESALEVSRSLQEQHSAAQQTIETLESKVKTLEEHIRTTQAVHVTWRDNFSQEAATREESQQATMGSMFAEFRKTIEDRWENVKQEWEAERERMETARNDWEGRMRGLEDGMAVTSAKFETGLTGLANQLAGIKQNGFIPLHSKHTGGLVTPPSPRSLSDADSDSDNPLDGKVGTKTRRRSRSRSHRGRATKATSRSRSPATSTSATLVDGISAPGTDSSVASLHSRRSSADSPTVVRSGDVAASGAAPLALDMAKFRSGNGQYLPTPESSVHIDDAAQAVRKGLQQSNNNVQFAVGVFVLGFATAAVLWRGGDTGIMSTSAITVTLAEASERVSVVTPGLPPPSRVREFVRKWRETYMHTYTACTMFASIGGFIFGFDTGSIGPVTTMDQFLDRFSPITPIVQGLIVSCILITAATFSLFAGPLSDRISRKHTMTVGGAIFAVGSAIVASASKLPQIFAGRCLAGAGEGLFLSVITVYTCEIAPAAIRGTLACTIQLFITIGVASGYFVCYGTNKLEGDMSWRTPFILQALVSACFSAGTPFLVHSPRWLLHVGRHDDALKAWTRLGLGPTEAEKEDIKTSSAEREQQQQQNWKTELRQMWKKDVRKRTVLGCFLMGMQQLSGIDGVLYYAPVLFTQAGLSSTKAAFLASGVSGLLNVACTLVTQPFQDKWGRRPSILLGGSAIAACMLTIGSIYASSAHTTQPGRWAIIVLIYLFVVAFAMSWAIVIRTCASEIQPARTRAAATSLGQAANWVVNWVVAFSTPLFLAQSTSGPYFLFGACSALTVAIAAALLPESKGVSLEALDEIFQTSPWRRMVRSLPVKHPQMGLARVYSEGDVEMAAVRVTEQEPDSPNKDYKDGRAIAERICEYSTEL